MGKWAKVPKKQGVKQSEHSKQYGKAKDGAHHRIDGTVLVRPAHRVDDSIG